MKKYFEYRGVENAVYARILEDSPEHFLTDIVKDFTGVSEISKVTESVNEAHFYDNVPAIVVDSSGVDEIAINASGIPFPVLAEITGETYEEDTGELVEEEADTGYFAFGYVTNKTDGTKVLVWRLKGKFSIPGTTSATKDSGTDANGQELTFTGVTTIHRFNLTGRGARAVNIDTSLNPDANMIEFFASVQTPDLVHTVVLQTAEGELLETSSGFILAPGRAYT